MDDLWDEMSDKEREVNIRLRRQDSGYGSGGDESDDGDEEGDEEDGEEAASQPVGIMINGARASSQGSDDTDGLGESFGGMSISPARPGHTPQVLVV